MKSARFFNNLSVLITMLLLSACATTKMTSQVNSAHADRPITKVMVAADFAELEYKQAAESRLCEKISAETTTQCVESGQVFFPGQDYSDDERIGRNLQLASSVRDFALGIETLCVNGARNDAHAIG